MDFPPHPCAAGSRQQVKLPWVQSNRIRSVGDGALNALADPPDSVGCQPCVIIKIEAVDRRDQAADSFVDQVARRDAPAVVSLGDVGDKVHIRPWPAWF